MTRKNPWRWVITFNLKPYTTNPLVATTRGGIRRRSIAVWPIRFHSRSDAEAFLNFISPQLFANSTLPDGRQLASCSIERFRA